jgi:murein DD-endopeptidase MepM/ murein hydrolase activator NlpD
MIPGPVQKATATVRRWISPIRLLPALLCLAIVAVSGGGTYLVAMHRHGHPPFIEPRVTAGTDPAPSPIPSASPVAPDVQAEQELPTTKVVPVAALKSRVLPSVLVVADHTLNSAEQAKLRSAAGASLGVVMDAATVTLGQGQTVALGVDPSTFRAFTPKGTAEYTPLWESVARGDAAVAHTVAHALEVPLGGSVALGRKGAGKLPQARVGAFATTALPGVGVVVDQQQSARFGLRKNAAALLVLSNPNSAGAVATAIPKAVPGTVAVSLQSLLPDAPAKPPAKTTTGAQGWVFPANGPITQGYKGPSGHPGIDIGAPLGSPIYAAASGYILYAGPASGFGNEIIIQHAGGVQTVYGHMRYVYKRSGPVTAGQVIALVGDEGHSTGPHLHFEVHIHNTLTNPLAWLVAHGVKIPG